jgi:hypothetical protein
MGSVPREAGAKRQLPFDKMLQRMDAEGKWSARGSSEQLGKQQTAHSFLAYEGFEL